MLQHLPVSFLCLVCQWHRVNVNIDIRGIFFYRPRMDAHKDTRIIIPMAPDLLGSIEDYRYAARLPTRAAAIRQLIQLGLEAVRKRQKEVAE